MRCGIFKRIREITSFVRLENENDKTKSPQSKRKIKLVSFLLYDVTMWCGPTLVIVVRFGNLITSSKSVCVRHYVDGTNYVNERYAFSYRF